MDYKTEVSHTREIRGPKQANQIVGFEKTRHMIGLYILKFLNDEARIFLEKEKTPRSWLHIPGINGGAFQVAQELSIWRGLNIQ
jgi:hypothetical protein